MVKRLTNTTVAQGEVVVMVQGLITASPPDSNAPATAKSCAAAQPPAARKSLAGTAGPEMRIVRAGFREGAFQNQLFRLFHMFRLCP